MSRGYGEVQRFVLDYLGSPRSDHGRTVRGIAEEWVHWWLVKHGKHDCRDFTRPEQTAPAEGSPQPWIECDCVMELRRADRETVRRALKSLEADGVVKLERHCMECGSDLLYAYPRSLSAPRARGAESMAYTDGHEP